MGNFMIGTKFYRIGASGVPEIIRLKKQKGNVLYFNTGDYNTYLTQEEKDSMIEAFELKANKDKSFTRLIDFFGNCIEQNWKVISDSDTGDYIKFKVENIGISMTSEELKENYTRLIPDGFITISNATYPINNGKETGFDVMVTLNKPEQQVPEIICRQDTIDIFKFSNSRFQVPIGISIPRISCPENMNYLDFLYSKECKDFKYAAVYMDDSLDTILKYIGSLNKYNNTMKRLKEKYANSRMVGCHDNVYDLLIGTGFYSDFQSIFGVYTFPFGIDTSRSDFNASELRLLNSVVNNSSNTVITEASYCPFDKSIKADNLGSKYMFINAGNAKESDVFVVAYTESKID